MIPAGTIRLLALLALAACDAHLGEGPVGGADGGVGQADGGPTGSDPDGGPTGEPAGTWAEPIPIGALPFTDTGDTTGAIAEVDAYSCAPGTNEGGGEVVYRLELAAATMLRVTVDDVAGDGVDVDVHLLGGPAADSCQARDNQSFTAAAAAGVHYVVADSWVDGGGNALEGPYTITVSEDTPASGGDCLTSPIECTEDDTPDVNGVPAEPAGVGGCPPGMTKVSGFCIDRWEAILVLVEGTPAGWSPYANPGNRTVEARSVPGAVPQGYITQVQAAGACAEAGKRLCTDSEWLRACRGPDNDLYPYGDVLLAGVCNDDRECHPAVQYFETGADWIWSELGNPCINQLPDGLAETGSHPDCITEEGALDMMGNLHEWTADPNGTFRGGFYVDTVLNGPGCTYATTAHDVTHWDYSTGFRCCADL
jgi:formylglycine-generating enzyme